MSDETRSYIVSHSHLSSLARRECVLSGPVALRLPGQHTADLCVVAPEAGFFPMSGNERLLEMQALSFVGCEAATRLLVKG